MDCLDDGAALPAGGLLARFENINERKSCKRMIPCHAGTAEFMRHDYLKPVHLPVDRVDRELNYTPGSNLNETRFHRGFHRRHMADIQSDAARLEAEMAQEALREERSRASIEATREFKDRHTFNILNGEGIGRESEFRQVGKKILNPCGSMEGIFNTHANEASNRMKASKHRYFEVPVVEKHDRTANIFNEGLRDTTRETAILGYGASGNRRTRSESLGVSDNYRHLSYIPPGPQYEPARHSNHSQIILG